MGLIKTKEEIKLMRDAGKRLATVLSEIEKKIQPGITTLELDKFAEDRIHQLNGIPTFKGYSGFPKSICSSINEEVVHTIPSDRIIQPGDLISIDCGFNYKGYNADSAISVLVEPKNKEKNIFFQTALQALEDGINAAQAGNYVQDISKAIHQTIKSNGYSTIKELTGHGIGKDLHEEPSVPNYPENKKGQKLKPGMTIAIEPIFAMGKGDIYTAKDNWNILTADNSLAIQVEHTVLITANGPEILTKRQ